MTDAIEIYTDGAASGNPGPGGLGIVMKYKQLRKEVSQGFRRTTNNRM
ncbi:MAG: RNase H family protein, partial [Bacteroidia bacterium]